MTQTFSLALVAGDGIGPEVTREALSGAARGRRARRRGLRRPAVLPRGRAVSRRPARSLPDTVLDEIRGHDAILLGAVGGRPGDPSLPPGLLERGLLLRLRFELDHHVNLPPVAAVAGRVLAAAASPGDVDFVVVREGTEGPYVGNGGVVRARHRRTRSPPR